MMTAIVTATRDRLKNRHQEELLKRGRLPTTGTTIMDTISITISCQKYMLKEYAASISIQHVLFFIFSKRIYNNGISTIIFR